MKSPGGGSSSGGFPTGPTLTPQQKAKRDREEAAKARKESRHAREEAGHAREEAAHARGEAKHAEQLARKDVKEGFKTEAKRDEARAGRDRARARRDDARAGRDMARSGRDAARSRRDMGRARTAGLARAGRPGAWILGHNDQYLTCAATAVANALLLATGIRVSDDDVVGLHVAAAGNLDAEVSIPGVLEAAAESGLAGIRLEQATDLLDHPQDVGRFPKVAHADFFGVGDEFRLAGDHVPRFAPVHLGEQPPGYIGAARELLVEPGPVFHPLIVEVALHGGLHAAVLADGHLITWGHAVPVTTAFLDEQVSAAWAVAWPAGPSRRSGHNNTKGTVWH